MLLEWKFPAGWTLCLVRAVFSACSWYSAVKPVAQSKRFARETEQSRGADENPGRLRGLIFKSPNTFFPVLSLAIVAMLAFFTQFCSMLPTLVHDSILSGFLYNSTCFFQFTHPGRCLFAPRGL